MNPNDPVQQVVSKAATVQDIYDDHIKGLSGYQIAEKYGLDPERVKNIINEGNNKLAFVPANEDGEKVAPVDHIAEGLIEPLAEGEEPNPKSAKGHK